MYQGLFILDTDLKEYGGHVLYVMALRLPKLVLAHTLPYLLPASLYDYIFQNTL